MGTTLKLTFGCCAWKSSAVFCHAAFPGSAVALCHHVSVTESVGNGQDDDAPPLLDALAFVLLDPPALGDVPLEPPVLLPELQAATVSATATASASPARRRAFVRVQPPGRRRSSLLVLMGAPSRTDPRGCAGSWLIRTARKVSELRSE